MGPKILVFDLETRKLAADLHKDNDEGWRLLRAGKGGISALAVWDSKENWCYLYDDTEILEAAAHLESADVLIGWNSKSFDVPVVEGVLGRSLVLREHVDIYDLVKQSLAKMGQKGRRGEYTLDAVCSRTFGARKIEQGEMAPTLAATGKWARLFRYCQDDVRLTRKLLNHIQSEGGIVSVNQTFLPVKLPDTLTRAGCQ